MSHQITTPPLTVISLAELLQLGVCREARKWTGNQEFPYTLDGVRAAVAAGAKLEWLVWLFGVTRCGDAEMWRLAGTRVITEDAEVTSGSAVCLVGSPVVTVSGGWMNVSGDATPTITVRGGDVRVYGNAKPTITVSGGEVHVYDGAKPPITMSGGEVHVYGAAKPTITVNGGWVHVYGAAKPTITVNGGEVRVYGDALPTITVNGGEVRVYGDALPVVRREDDTEIEPVVGAYGLWVYRV